MRGIWCILSSVSPSPRLGAQYSMGPKACEGQEGPHRDGKQEQQLKHGK